MTVVRLVRAARYLNLRTHSPGHPVLNTQLRTPSPHRIPLELRSHRPRPITLVSLQGRLPNLHRLRSPAIHNVSWMLRTRRLTGWRMHSPQVQGILSQRLRGGLLSNNKSCTLNLSSQPFMVVGGGLFIATWQPDLICPK